MDKIRVFVSFDIENDRELYDLLLEQSKASSAGFVVTGGSERPSPTDAWTEKLRRRIGDADQMIVLCGVHTGDSSGMSAELRIAQQEKTPYILLWGRRESMCTKPIGARSSEGMYSWTTQILQDQIDFTLRRLHADAAAETARNPTPKA